MNGEDSHKEISALLINQYIQARKLYVNQQEEFFVFSDGSPLLASHLRLLIKRIIGSFNLDASLYSVHSLRIGRCTDLVKSGYPIEVVKRMGRWKTSIIYNYI